MEPVIPITTATSSRRIAAGTITRLHISAGDEPDVHLIGANGGCSLHPLCTLHESGLPPEDGIRVIVAAQDGVQVGGLPGPLDRDCICFVLGRPVEVSDIAGGAAALSIDRVLLPALPDDSVRNIARITVRELSNFLCTLIDQVAAFAPHARHPSTQATARAILGVLSSIYVEEIKRGSLQVSRTPADDLYAQAIMVIKERIAEPDLSPAIIAEACSVTPRYLHMLFERRGETVSTLIIGERLERCRSDLADHSLSGSSISEIAARWGFSTPSHFSQKFRSRYGMTPREWRARTFKEP